MAGFNYNAAQVTAQNLIKRFGSSGTISRVESSYDEVAGERVVSAVNTDPVSLVNLPASTALAQQFENGIIEEYKKGKIRFFYVAAKGMTFEPEAADLLYYDGTVWELAGATPLNPAGTPVYYTIGVRASNLSELPTVP